MQPTVKNTAQEKIKPFMGNREAGLVRWESQNPESWWEPDLSSRSPPSSTSRSTLSSFFGDLGYRSYRERTGTPWIHWNINTRFWLSVFLKTISRWFQCCPSTHLAFGNQFTSRLSLIKSNGDSEAIFPNLTRHQLWCMRTPPSSDIGSIWDPPQSSATKTLCLILLQVLRISVVKNNTDRGTECLRLDPQKLCKREAICSGNVKGSFQILALFRFLPPRASWQIKHCFWEGRAQRVCSQLQRGRKHPERHVGCAGLEESSHPFQTREHPNSLQLLYSGSHLLWRQNIIWVISFIVHNSSSGFSCKLWRHSSKLFRSSELLSLKIIQSSGFHLPPVGLPSSLGGQQTFSAEARE